MLYIANLKAQFPELSILAAQSVESGGAYPSLNRLIPKTVEDGAKLRTDRERQIGEILLK
jgi:hypothetical protein